jgi:hypothetical protein
MRMMRYCLFESDDLWSPPLKFVVTLCLILIYIFYSMLEAVTLITDRGNYINNASDATRAGDYNIDKFIYCPKIYHFYKDQDIF